MRHSPTFIDLLFAEIEKQLLNPKAEFARTQVESLLSVGKFLRQEVMNRLGEYEGMFTPPLSFPMPPANVDLDNSDEVTKLIARVHKCESIEEALGVENSVHRPNATVSLSENDL